jgi:ABC-type nitrate/sulfonate/bicarbonate transport system ATPase subunit
MIFQDPMTSLTPHLRIGDQIAEPLVAHRGMGWQEARARAAVLLDQVRMSDVPRRLRQYPHELSGGMRQRAMIAMALACDPKLLIADEPTTALDVSVQAQLLKLLRDLIQERGMALALVTHDMGVIAALADDVLVMRQGQVIEQAPCNASSLRRRMNTHAPCWLRRRGSMCRGLHRARRRAQPRRPCRRAMSVSGIACVVAGWAGRAGSPRSTTCRSMLAPARHWVWSANPAAGSPRSRARCSGSGRPPGARSCGWAAPSRISPARNCARCATECRLYSRIRSRASIRACASWTSSLSRCERCGPG